MQLFRYAEIWCVSILCFIGLVGALDAGEYKIYQKTSDKKLLVVGTVKFRSAEELQLVLKNFYLSSSFGIPREGLSADQRKTAVAEVKAQLLKNKARYEVVWKDKPQRWSKESDIILEANEGLGKVIASIGELEEFAWLQQHFGDQYWAGLPAAQLRIRHGLGFDPKSPPDSFHCGLANAMGIKNNKVAAEWLYAHREDFKKNNIGYNYGLMGIMLRNKLPEASDYAKEIITRYRKVMSEEAIIENKISGFYFSEVPWALVQLHSFDNVDELGALLDGLMLTTDMANSIIVSASSDPRPWIDGTLGTLEHCEPYQIRNLGDETWERPLVRAAMVKRSSADGSIIEDYVRKRLLDLILKHKVYPKLDPYTGIYVNEIMGVNLSTMRVSAETAKCTMTRSRRPTNVRLYKYAPWVQFEWYLKMAAANLGDVESILYSADRLSPMDHEQVEKALLGAKHYPNLAIDSALLVHKYTTTSFQVPIEYELGGIHSAATKLSGEFIAVGMHSFIRTIARKNGDKLMVGIKIESEHYDGGGLASAIAQLGDEIAPFYENHCRKMIGEVRWESAQAKGTLEYMNTTESGLHFFQADLKGSSINDVHLHFDWTPPGSKYVLSHALYEPLFGLK